MNNLRPSRVTIISNGRWNKMLFTPSWVATNLFNLPKDSEITGFVNAEEYEFVFNVGSISIKPKERVLEIVIDDQIASKVEEGALIFSRVIKLLPHTPISATGFNVKYQITKDVNSPFVESIRDKIAKVDDSHLAQLRLLYPEKDHSRYVVIDEVKKDSFTLNFNFHYTNKLLIDEKSFMKNFETANVIINESPSLTK